MRPAAAALFVGIPLLAPSAARASVQTEEAKLIAPDGAADDRFGEGVAFFGDVAVVGSGLDDDNGFQSGSAYVFRYDGATWALEAKLVASDGEALDLFGSGSIGLSGDVLVVGASGDDDNGAESGSAYVFRYNGLSWEEEAKLVASDGAAFDGFGGMIMEPTAQQAGLFFGDGVAVFGDTIVVGAPGDDDFATNAGSAYVFRYDGNTWVEEAKLLPPVRQGSFVGTTVAISGDVVALGAAEDNDDDGALTGSAYVFRYDGMVWEQEAKLVGSDREIGDLFGSSVGVSGGTVVVGALQDDGSRGSVYLFRYDGTAWLEEAKLVASDGAAVDQFGAAVAISDGVTVIGARGDDDNGDRSGSAYVFRFNGSSWVEDAKLLASVGMEGDFLGLSVALWGNTALVGASERFSAPVNPGSAYVFRLAPFSDVDGDGEHDRTDACPETPPGLAIDQAGCSLEQFCAALGAGPGPLRAICVSADWLNDEPLGPALDCMFREDRCVPR